MEVRAILTKQSKVIEAWDLNFHLGNVVKYISRAGKKSKNSVEDLKESRMVLESICPVHTKKNN